jgi:hypothetical protein
VTVTIIGIIAAVALPAMLDLSPRTDAGPLEPVRTLLLEAKHDATSSSRRVEVIVIPASGRYRVIMAASTDLVIREGVLPLRDVRTRSPEDRFRVVFDPVGIGVGDSLAATGVLLRVDWRTGAIEVER